MKTSKVFKQARKLIAAGKYTFICHACAVQFGWDKDMCYDATYSYAEQVVQSRLDGCSTLETWLWDKHQINVSDNPVKLRNTRLAWLDSLIAEFEAKGD